MARPKLAEEQRPVPLCIRVPPLVADDIIHFAAARDLSVYAFLGLTVARLFRQWKTTQLPSTSYTLPQSSTLSRLLSESPTHGRFGP